MASKALMALGFLLVAALVLISSEVAAGELAEDAKEVQTNEPVNDVKQGYGGGGGYPGRGGGYPGHGGGGGYPGHGGGGGYCRYGRCCGRYGCRCCNYAGEVPDSQAEDSQAEAVNDVKQGYGGGGGYPGRGGGYPGNGGGGGYCRYGRCCGRYGCRCCNYAGEVPDSQAEAKPQN